jgi:hypothetical protein
MTIRNGHEGTIRLRRGPLAHLVERFHGMEEVTGSSPVGSTKIRSGFCKKDGVKLLPQFAPKLSAANAACEILFCRNPR